jgi:hypothetical protein
VTSNSASVARRRSSGMRHHAPKHVGPAPGVSRASRPV